MTKLNIKKSINTNYSLVLISQHGKLISILLPVLIASIITIFLCSSGPIEKIRTWFELEFPTSQAIALSNFKKEKSLINYFLGPQAVVQCVNSCSTYKPERQSACKRYCHKLSLTEYARRIRKNPLSTDNEVNKITNSCEQFSKKQNFNPGMIEMSLLLRAYNSLLRNLKGNSFAKLKSYFYTNHQLISEIVSQIKDKDIEKTESEPQNTALSTTISTNLCLQNYQILFSIGAIITKQNEDSFSYNLYTAVAQHLHIKLEQEAERLGLELKHLYQTSEIAEADPLISITPTTEQSIVSEAGIINGGQEKFIKFVNTQWVMADINSRDIQSTTDTCYIQSEKYFCSLNDKNSHQLKIKEIEEELYFEKD